MSEATSVGQIGLDLVVNKKDFNKQMSGIQNLATKVGKKLAAAFAVKKLVDFSEKCIELGSDLSEVQNVWTVRDDGQEVHRYLRCYGQGFRVQREAGIRYVYHPDRAGGRCGILL